MSTEPDVPIAISMVRSLALGVSRLGLDGNRLLAAAGASPAGPDGYASSVAVATVLADLARENEIEHMGLELAKSISLGWFGTLDYQFSTSATLADALANIRPELTSLVQALRLEIGIEGDVAYMRARHTVERLGTEAIVAMMSHFNLAVMVRRMRDVLGDDAVQLNAVRFSAPAPASTAAHDRFFRAAVEFGTRAGFDELVLPVALFGTPLLTADPMLAQALRERALGGRGSPPADPSPIASAR